MSAKFDFSHSDCRVKWVNVSAKYPATADEIYKLRSTDVLSISCIFRSTLYYRVTANGHWFLITFLGFVWNLTAKTANFIDHYN